MAFDSIVSSAKGYQESSIPKMQTEQKAAKTTQGFVQGRQPEITIVKQGVANTINYNPTEEKSEDKDTQPNQKQLQVAIKNANNQLKQNKAQRTQCEFTYHEQTNRISIKIRDKETQEVIREIPAEETLKMLEKVMEMAGLLVDEKR